MNVSCRCSHLGFLGEIFLSAPCTRRLLESKQQVKSKMLVFSEYPLSKYTLAAQE